MRNYLFVTNILLVSTLVFSALFTGLIYSSMENYDSNDVVVNNLESSKFIDPASVRELTVPVIDAKTTSESARARVRNFPHYRKTRISDDREEPTSWSPFQFTGVGGHSESELVEVMQDGPSVNVTVLCYDINGDPLYLASVLILDPAWHYAIYSGFTNSSGVFEATNIPAGTIDVCVSWGNASAPSQPGYYMYFSGVDATSSVDVVVNAQDLRSGGGLAKVTLTLQNSTGEPMVDTLLYPTFNATDGVGFPPGMGPITDAEGMVTLYLANDTWAPEPAYYTFFVCQKTPSNNTLLMLTNRLVSSDENTTLMMPSLSEMATVDLAFSYPSGISLMRDIRLFFEFPQGPEGYLIPPEIDRDALALMYLPSKLDGKMLFLVFPFFFLPVADDGFTSLYVNASIPSGIIAVYINTTSVPGGPWLFIPMKMFGPLSPGETEHISMGGSYLKLRSVTPSEAYLGSEPKLNANFTDEFYNPFMLIVGNGSTSFPTGMPGILSHLAIYNLTIWYPNGTVWYDGQAMVQDPYGGFSLNGILSGVNPPFPSLDELGTYNYSIFIDAGPWPLSPLGTPGEPLTGSFEVLEPIAQATFGLDKDFDVWAEDDHLPSGNYTVDQRNFGIWINNDDDDTDTVLGDLRFYVEASDILGVFLEEHAEWDPGYANWTFPPEFVIHEKEGFRTGFTVKRFESCYLNLTLSRVMNETVFTNDGYQMVDFTLSFTDTEFLWSWGHIGAWERWEVNASIVPGTFQTDAPLEWSGEEMHSIDFGLRKEEIQAGVNYNFSAIVKVELTGEVAPPILYKPEFAVSYVVSQKFMPDGEGYMVEMPPEILPDYIYLAQASTNTSNTWTLEWQDHVAGILGEVSKPAGARATFYLDENLAIWTEDDILIEGDYQASPNYHLDIGNEDDDSDTVLGDLEFYAEAQNITWVDWWEYAEWDSSHANWTFPPEFVIYENEGFGTGFGVERPETVHLNLSIARWMNQTTFSSDGYQLVKFIVNYANTEFLWSWGHIEVHEPWEVNASIVPGTFQTDAPLEWYDEGMHWVHFGLRKEEIQAGVNYNFSAIVKVELTGEVAPPILYKPDICVGYAVRQEFMFGGEGNIAEMPPEILPDHVYLAQASTNTSNLWNLERKDQVWGSLGQVSKAVGARATFYLDENLGVGTDDDILIDGDYQLSSSFGIWINNDDDDTDTVLGDLGFYAEAQNITWVDWWEYAEWDSSHANWTFPPEFVIHENEGFGTNFGIEHLETAHLNLTISRWMSQTTFSSDGYQLVKFKVKYTNTEFLWSWGHIAAHEHWEVNASIVPGTFQTDAPLEWSHEEMHWVDFGLRKEEIQAGVNYNFSVIVKVELTAGRTVAYKPHFSIGRGFYHQTAAGPEGYIAEMPPEMLPENVMVARAQTNASNLWLLERHNHIMVDLHEVTMVLKQTIIFFNLNPNPATVGQTITLKGILVDEFATPLAGETVKLYARPLAGSWTYITSLTTNEYGMFTWQATIPWTVTPDTFIFAVYYPGSEMYESTYNLAALIVQ